MLNSIHGFHQGLIPEIGFYIRAGQPAINAIRKRHEVARKPGFGNRFTHEHVSSEYHFRYLATRNSRVCTCGIIIGIA
jgi:hypothetical protein